MKIPKVSYYQFFQQCKSQNYESTQDVVDSLLRYEQLLNYRFYTTRRDNDDYWFLSNLVDMTFKDYHFYKMIVQHGRQLDDAYLLHMLRVIRKEIMANYTTIESRTIVHSIRDTLAMLDTLEAALDKMIKVRLGLTI